MICQYHILWCVETLFDFLKLKYVQVLTTHLENMRRTDAREQIPNPDTDSDEQVKQIGKSNLDKWLQALLVKGTASAGSSPGRDITPLEILSPALSQISEVAVRESLERARQQVRSPHPQVTKPKFSVT